MLGTNDPPSRGAESLGLCGELDVGRFGDPRAENSRAEDTRRALEGHSAIGGAADRRRQGRASRNPTDRPSVRSDSREDSARVLLESSCRAQVRKKGTSFQFAYFISHIITWKSHVT